MIIASILPEHEKEILRIKKGISLPDYLEIRLDLLNSGELISALRVIPGKKIASCRRKQDSGFFQGNEKERKIILEKSIISGLFDLIDVEVGTEAIHLIKKYKNQDFIVSYHDPEKTPDDLHELYESLISIPGARFYKLVTYAQRLSDNLKIKSILEKANSEGVPFVSFCMGERGMLSRILSIFWGSEAVYSSLFRSKETAPGQMFYGDMESSYRINKINLSTKVFGVIGNPLRHTLSPAIHNAAYKYMNLNYVCIPMKIDSPDEIFRHSKDINLAGIAVTSPFKEKVIPFLHDLDEDAKNIGAANTVIIKDKKLLGYNTDHSAFIYDFTKCVDLRSERIAVLGDGGAALAACYALYKERADFQIFSRKEEKGRELAGKFHAVWHPLGDLKDIDYDVLLNCTTAGMYPDAQHSPIKKEWIKGNVVFDLIYNPPVTTLMNEAQNRRAKVIGGKGMFLKQAAIQFKLLTGKDAPANVMDHAFESSLLFLDNAKAG